MNRTIILTLITAAIVAACTVLEPEPIISNFNYSIISGDTVKTNKNFDSKLKGKFVFDKILLTVGDTIVTYKEPKLHTPKKADIDLSKLKNNDSPDLKGKPLQMIVIGGSLSAGVRDGGYFNEGMLTSYPNLVARQMALKKFELPLFDKNDYNGSGRKIATNFNPTGGPFQKFKNVVNNVGSSNNEDKLKLKAYEGDPDNLAIPHFNRLALRNWTKFWQEEKDETYQRIKGKNPDLISKIKTKKFDFFILESGLDDMISYFNSETNGLIGGEDYTFKDNLSYEEQSRILPELNLIRESIFPSKAKGVLFNLPNIFDMPFLLDANITNEKLLSNPFIKYQHDNENITLGYIGKYKITTKLDSLLSPKINGVLKNLASLNSNYTISLDVTQKWEKALDFYNQPFINIGKKYGFPIVDIYSLYKNIAKGVYTTDDGVVVNKQNFYSSDLINPTPFGQAVVANEVIKTINLYYKTTIPLVPTREYLSIK